MLLLVLACVPAPDSAEPVESGATAAADTADTSGASDSGESGDSADSGDTGPTGPPRAVWVWHPPWDDPEPFADALVDGGFTTAWLADYEPDATHHALIAALHARHVEAWALAGDPSWVRGAAAEAHAQAIAAFNTEGEPYDGVQHDTELTSLPGFRTDPQGLTDTFVATIDAARAAAGVPFTVATVVWLDPPLFTEIAAHVDGVALMDYRDDVARIEKDASEELAGTTPVWLGLELMEDPEGDAVSFHEEGHDAIVAAMAAVEADEAAAPAFAGMAVHDWDAWVTTP